MGAAVIERPDWPWLVAAVVAEAAMWGVYAFARVAVGRRDHVHAAPSPAGTVPDPLDLGDESPAVVNLMTHGFRVSAAAAAATVLDLGRRGALTIVPVNDADSLVQLHRTDRDLLRPYERQVLGELEDRAVDGVVPVDACNLGPSHLSRRWWRRFERSVVDECIDAGWAAPPFARPPFGPASSAADLLSLAFLVLALAPLVLVGIGHHGLFGAAAPSLVGLMAVVGPLVLLALGPSAPWATDEGLVVAARWLARRRELTAIDFAGRTPAAVTVWGPYLAYAAAMDLAPDVAEAIPFGHDQDTRHGWSEAEGHWRRVRITYPLWRPFWGYRPGRVVLGAVPVLLLGPVLTWICARVHDVPAAHPAAVGFGALAVAALVAVLGGLYDLARPRTFDGEVIRLVLSPSDWDWWWSPIVHRNRWYLAVDDGRASSIRAWEISKARFDELRPGDLVTVRVTRVFGRVLQVDVRERDRRAWSPEAEAASIRRRDVGPGPRPRKHRPRGPRRERHRA